MTPKEKAAGVLDTPATADRKQCPAIVAPSAGDCNDKAQATLIAAFALKGFAVHTLSCGGYLVAKWDLSRHCPDLRALAEFARMVGARP